MCFGKQAWMFAGLQSQTEQLLELQLLDSACLDVTTSRKTKKTKNKTLLITSAFLTVMFLLELTLQNVGLNELIRFHDPWGRQTHLNAKMNFPQKLNVFLLKLRESDFFSEGFWPDKKQQHPFSTVQQSHSMPFSHPWSHSLACCPDWGASPPPPTVPWTEGLGHRAGGQM